MLCFSRCYRSGSVSDCDPIPISIVAFKPPDMFLRMKILNDVDRGMELEEIDRTICLAYGQGAISYPDIDFWFHRFTRGMRDLKYDRSLDPPPLTLSTLPTKGLTRILEALDVGDRLIFRQVSKHFEPICSSAAFSCTNIKVQCKNSLVSIKYDSLEVIYKPVGDGCRVKHGNKIVLSYLAKDYLELALEELKLVLGNSKLQLKLLQFVFYGARVKKRVINDLKLFLRRLNHRVHVQELCIKWCELSDVLSIIPFLQPRILETIQVNHNLSEKKNLRAIKKLAKLEQWKQARCLGMQFRLFQQSLYDGRMFSQFRRIHLFHLFVDDIDVAWIPWILKVLPRLERLQLLTYHGFTYFCVRVSLNIGLLDCTPGNEIASFRIPDCDQVFMLNSKRIKGDNYEIVIDRPY